MMYTVIWKLAAELELARLWNTATDRQAVADAADRADALLASNPSTQGESRSGNRRLVFERPLAILFEIDNANRIVYVLAVQRARRQP